MMSRWPSMRARLGVAAVVVVTAVAITGCGGGSDSDSGDAASTATDTPASTAAATTAPATTAPATTAPAEVPLSAGTAAAGKVVFTRTCAGCHAGLGTRAGFGPQLSGQGLKPAFIKTTLENGRGQMPAGLVSGQELADVVAYVESLQ